MKNENIQPTFTFEALSKKPIQQRAAMMTECRRHKRKHFKTMRYINLKSFP